MRDSNILSVSMFGGRSITFEGKSIDNMTVRSKSIWTLLEYLIIYRNRTVTHSELIDLLYPDEKSDAPLNALKTLVHRARQVLNSLEYADGKQIIQQYAGGYMWSNEIPMHIDIESFQNAVSEAAALDLDKEAQLELRLKAISLYKGDLLPDSAYETWVVPISSYYHYQYINTVNLALADLLEKGRYSDMIYVAQNALAIDPYEEHLYYYLILALANTNQISIAKAQYENMTQLFLNEFGVSPSNDLQTLYKRISKSDNGVETDLNAIKSLMSEESSNAGAFYCEYEFFKDIYRLEVRSSARKGIPIHICLINADGKDGLRLSNKSLDNVMKKLSDCIKVSLRSGDIYSRYSVSQFVVLLPNANFENSALVMERMTKTYKRQHAHSPASITYSIQTIDTTV